MSVKIFWFGIKFTFLYDSRKKLNFVVILAMEKNRNNFNTNLDIVLNENSLKKTVANYFAR